MPTAQDFITNYGDNPWQGITDKTRQVFIPDLLDVFRKSAFYQQFIPFSVDMLQSHAETMTFTTMYELEPNINPIGLRQMWVDHLRTDSERKSITMEHHGSKVVLHKYDQYVMQWRKNGLSGLREINRAHLATAMVRHLDRLAFKALLEGTWKMYGKAWDKANFAALSDTLDGNGRGADDYDPWTGDEIFLGMHTRDQHGAVDAVGSMGANVMALTTPGTVYSIQRDPNWKSVNQYANPSAALRYEVGAFRNVRYMPNVDQVLWNAGNIVMQGVIKEPLHPGSGAARNVDANREIGQENLEYAAQGAKRYIQLDPTMALADFQQFKVDDYVTIHRVRMNNTNPRWAMSGVQDGVDPFEGTNMERRIVSVDEANRRIAVDKPILSEYYATDLGGTVYGYVTKGINIHPTIFLTGPNACVAGVTQSPQTYTPRPIDDFEAYWRLSWDAYMKYQIWNDHAVEVCFNTGPYRFKGLRRY